MIILPSQPGPRSATPRVLDFGGFLEPSSGAQVQRINRLGSRYAVAFTMPPLRNQKDGRIWVNRLVRGMQEGVRMEYPLLDFYPGTPGNFVVDGAGQSGKLLALRGGTPNYAFREGQPISLEIGGQHYLDFIAQEAIADGAGDVEIMLSQMLRAEQNDGDALHVSQPMIEGFPMGDPVAWEISLERLFSISFEIQETR